MLYLVKKHFLAKHIQYFSHNLYPKDFEKQVLEGSIAVYVISTIRYQGAQKKLKWYGKELDDLQNMYEEQEKSGKKSGRRRKET